MNDSGTSSATEDVVAEFRRRWPDAKQRFRADIYAVAAEMADTIELLQPLAEDRSVLVLRATDMQIKLGKQQDEIERLEAENQVLRTPTIACENCGVVATYKFNRGPLNV